MDRPWVGLAKGLSYALIVFQRFRGVGEWRNGDPGPFATNTQNSLKIEKRVVVIGLIGPHPQKGSIDHFLWDLV